VRLVKVKTNLKAGEGWAPSGSWTSHDLEQAALQNIPGAKECFERSRDALAMVTANLVTLFNPQVMEELIRNKICL